MFCANCGKEYAAESNFCSSCGAAVVSAPPPLPFIRVQMVRPRHPRMIAGVCSGLALHYGWDLTVVRLVAVALTVLTSGFGVLAYIAAWIIIPDGLYSLPVGTQQQTGM